MKSLKFTGGGEVFNALRGTIENLNFFHGGRQWDVVFTSEIVSLYSFFHETIDFTFDLVEISETWSRHGISLWESNLGLNLGWDKWESFSSIVLDTTWMWDVQMMVDIMRS